MLNRNKVIQTLSALPATFSMEELIDQLVLLQKIESGIAQADKGETVSTKTAKSKLKKWLK